MYNMSPNIMVDVIDNSIVTVKSCEPSSQITPFLWKTEPEVGFSVKMLNCLLAFSFFPLCCSEEWNIISRPNLEKLNLIPFHDTKEASLHGHGDASKSLNPTTWRKSAFMEVSKLSWVKPTWTQQPRKQQKLRNCTDPVGNAIEFEHLDGTHHKG